MGLLEYTWYIMTDSHPLFAHHRVSGLIRSRQCIFIITAFIWSVSGWMGDHQYCCISRRREASDGVGVGGDHGSVDDREHVWGMDGGPIRVRYVHALLRSEGLGWMGNCMNFSLVCYSRPFDLKEWEELLLQSSALVCVRLCSWRYRCPHLHPSPCLTSLLFPWE